MPNICVACSSGRIADNGKCSCPEGMIPDPLLGHCIDDGGISDTVAGLVSVIIILLVLLIVAVAIIVRLKKGANRVAQ